MFYSVVKTIHVIGIICWMAGLLYLPRLFIYHAENVGNPEINKLFKTMERKLFYIIIVPSMVISLVTGLILIHLLGMDGIKYWFFFKALGVLGLLISNWLCFCYMKDFSLDKNTKTSKYFRFFNEIPSIMMIIIVIFVIVKPL